MKLFVIAILWREGQNLVIHNRFKMAVSQEDAERQVLKDKQVSEHWFVDFKIDEVPVEKIRYWFQNVEGADNRVFPTYPSAD